MFNVIQDKVNSDTVFKAVFHPRKLHSLTVTKFVKKYFFKLYSEGPINQIKTPHFLLAPKF